MPKAFIRALQERYTASMRGFEWLCARLRDGATRERNVAIVLAAYTAIWTLYDVLSRSTEDIHMDMAEMVAWSRDLALGSPKHPQFGAWLAGLWFSVFPERDWAFYLLANGLIAFTLWIAWRLSEGRLDDNKRVAGLALLTVVPFFSFLAWKYNANTILIPLWAATTYLFFRSLETRGFAIAALAGIAAAGAMMGKYWSIFLLAGLGVAALASPHRRAYFRSAAPWITTLAGLVAIAPHLYWVATHNFSSFSYALDGHRAESVAAAFLSAGNYLLGFAAYFTLPLFLIAVLVRPQWPALLDTLWPRGASRRFVAVAFWAPVLLPIPVALLNQTELSSIWTMSACILAPIVLLSSPRIRVTPAVTAKILAVAAVFSLSSLAIAPARALRISEIGALKRGDEYKLIARALGKEWRRTNTAPLLIVGGEGNLVNGVSFYLRGRPSVFNVQKEWRTPLVNGKRIAREGMVLFCPVESADCIEEADEITKGKEGVRRIERTISRHYRGGASRAHRYLILTIPPQQAV